MQAALKAPRYHKLVRAVHSGGAFETVGPEKIRLQSYHDVASRATKGSATTVVICIETAGWRATKSTVVPKRNAAERPKTVRVVFDKRTT